jgi:subtilisin family serine protease
MLSAWLRSRGLGGLSRRKPVHRRRLLFEFLERRQVLSAASLVYGAVSAAWFGPAGNAEGAFESSRGSSDSSRWIVRFDASRSEALGGIAEAWKGFMAPTVLTAEMNRPWEEFTVISGLGLPGEVLVEAHVSPDQGAIDLARVPHLASFQLEQIVGGSSATFPNEKVSSSDLYSQLYGLNSIDAPDAWSISTGSSSTVVAEIDSGIDMTHPDLYQNIWLNNGEIPPALYQQLIPIHGDGQVTIADLNAKEPDGTYVYGGFVTDFNHNGYIDAEDLLADPQWADGQDNDGNGFKDDLFGWNFVANSNDPADDNSHGTHVAGTIAAVGNNGIGVTGVAWRAALLPLKFLDQNNQGSDANAIAAFNYMTMMKERYANSIATPQAGTAIQGANIEISNNSWGIGGALDAGLQKAVENAGDAGILTIAAAGNGNALGQGIDNDSEPFYPASFDDDRIISVAASDSADNLARNSNFGRTSVDIAAPGVGILSTIPGMSPENQYAFDSGTSMATPYVSGVAALIYSQHPNATPGEVRSAILQGADRLDSLAGQISTGGRLNALGALMAQTFAPRATLDPIPDITAVTSAAQIITVHLAAQSGSLLQASSIDANDIRVQRRGFSSDSVAVAVYGSAPTTDSFQLTVQYQVQPLDGKWNALAAGEYDVVLNAGHVRDNKGLTAASTTLGSFQVKITDPHVIFVSSTLDTNDANPGDGVAVDGQGQTTLRAAIQEINAQPQDDYTLVLPDGNYGFAFAGRNEDSAAAGDLDIVHKVTIQGTGVKTTVIDAHSLDRVFDVMPGGDLSLVNLTVSGGNPTEPTTFGHYADEGGGILVRGHMELQRCAITNNSSSSGGGGIAVLASGDVHIIDSTVDSNRTTNVTFGSNVGGGGVDNAGQLLVERSTISRNTTAAGYLSAFGGGGVVNREGGVAEIQNSTFSGNSAPNGLGGGVLSLGYQLIIDSSTLAENSASFGGGIANAPPASVIAAGGGSASVSYSIVGNNKAAAYQDVYGTFVSQGDNIVGVVEGAPSPFQQIGDVAGSLKQPLDIGLAPLANNGGPTLTYLPQSGSPAVDLPHIAPRPAGSLLVDQRGVARPPLTAAELAGGPSNLDAGAVQRFQAEIKGRVYIDANANHAFDIGEHGLAGWTVYLDDNNNGVLDAGELSTTTSADEPITPGTDETGAWSFAQAPPGVHKIRLVPQPGYTQLDPVDRKAGGAVNLAKMVDSSRSSPSQGRNYILGPWSKPQIFNGGVYFADGDGNGGISGIYELHDDGTIYPYARIGDHPLNYPSATLTSIDDFIAEGQVLFTGSLSSDPGGQPVKLFVRDSVNMTAFNLPKQESFLIPSRTAQPKTDFSLEQNAVIALVNYGNSSNGAIVSIAKDDARNDSVSGIVRDDHVPVLADGNLLTQSIETGNGANGPKGTISTSNFAADPNLLIEGDTGRGGVLISQPTASGQPGRISLLVRPGIALTLAAPGYVLDDGSNDVIDTVGPGAAADGNYYFTATVHSAQDATQEKQGIYLVRSDGSRMPIIDTETAKLLPAFKHPIVSFGELAARGQRLVFSAAGADGFAGMFLYENGRVYELASTDTQLIGADGQQHRVTEIYPVARHGVGFTPDPTPFYAFLFLEVRFTLKLDDGSVGIYKADFSAKADDQSDLGYDIVVGNNEVSPDVMFGFSAQPAEIHGVAFADQNRNTVRDLNESAIEGVQIYIDANHNGVYEAGSEQVTTTNANGSYSFNNLTALTSYTVAEIPPPEQKLTAPPTGQWIITPDAGQIVTGVNFGNVQASPTGSAGFRLQGTVTDAGGQPMAGVVVYLDKNGNGARDAGEPTTTSIMSGQYTFAGYDTGNYQVRLDLSNPLLQGYQVRPTLSNTFNAQQYSLGKNPSTAAAGDFDNKNGSDLAVVLPSQNQVQVFLNDGTGSFASGAVETLTTHNTPYSLAVADVNKDAWPDLIVTSLYDHDVEIYLNLKNVSAPFPLKPTFSYAMPTKSEVPSAITVGDFNGDTFSDIAVANTKFDQNQRQVSGEAAILLNSGNGDGKFGSPNIIPNVGLNPQGLAGGKFNGDANFDLAVANFNDNTVQILKGDGLGGFTKFGNPYVTGFGPSSIAAAELDGDGFLDLVVTNYAANKVSVYWGTSTGFTSTANDTYPAGFGPNSVVLTDIDGDGRTDIVVSNNAGSPDQNHVVLLRNQSSRKFSAAEPTGSATFPPDNAFSLVAANFKNDATRDSRINDFALVNPVPKSGSGNEDGHVTVLMNTVVANTSRRAVLVGADVTGLDLVLQPASLNHAPSFTKGSDLQNITDESKAVTIVNWATGISVGDGDSPLQSVHFIVTTDRSDLFAVQPAVNNNGTLTFTTIANKTGVAHVTIVAKDDGGTANGGIDQSDPQTTTIPITKKNVWHNARLPADVSDDNSVSADDVLTIINYINSGQTTVVPNDGRGGGPYNDVDGDHQITANDVLTVINYINAHPSKQGESQAAPDTVDLTPYVADDVPADLLDLLAADVAVRSKRRL